MSHDEGEVCACMADHRPEPMELAKHRILPGEYGGRYTADNIVWLCPTTHVNVHELLRAFIAAGRVLPYRSGSRYAHRIAATGYELIPRS